MATISLFQIFTGVTYVRVCGKNKKKQIILLPFFCVYRRLKDYKPEDYNMMAMDLSPSL
jgi:hypothetical protein